jgi:hypothetical protein
MQRILLPAAILMPFCLLQPASAQTGSATSKKAAKSVESPFACNLKAINSEERKRYERLSLMLFEGVTEKRELPDGYAFRLAAAVSMANAAEWADLESKCCPFFDFQLVKEREQGPLWLRLTGRPGVKEFIREEFRF